jgi:signal peptidase I
LEARLVSLSIFIAVTVLSLLVSAWALSRSARAVGSPRARFRAAIAAILLLIVLGIVFAVSGAVATPAAPVPALVTGLLLLIVQLVLVFLVLRSAFKLTTKRTFAPFGVYVSLVVAQLLLVVFVIKPFIVEAFVIPTKSMAPTIEPGDRLVVDKLLRPRRLELVAYWSQDVHPAIYCKRLIGLPGERIRFDQGGVFVNDQQVTLPSILAGRCHASPSALPPGQARYRDGESIALRPDEYFLIGDNVDVSVDSRLAGPSRASSLVGVVDLVYWPLKKARLMR